jgi:hypothetical protein
VLAHVGGVPIEESLIYLVPPLAVVAWIWFLGRRARRDLPLALPPEEPPGEEGAVAPGGEGGGHSPG